VVRGARRGRRSPSSFEITHRFSPKYTVAFRAESVAYFQPFGSGNSSKGRIGEADALYSSVFYLKEFAKVLAGIGSVMQRVSRYSSMVKWPIFSVLWIAEMVVSKSALADDSVISTRLRNRRSFVF
jgi:hypothetical protein